MHKLYFLYHAEAGRLAGMYSELRKAFGREPDALLEITHDVLGEFKLAWQSLADALEIPVEYYFRDQLPEPLEYFLRQQHVDLPAVVGLNRAGKNIVVCSGDDLARCQGKPEVLVEKLRNALILET